MQELVALIVGEVDEILEGEQLRLIAFVRRGDDAAKVASAPAAEDLIGPPNFR